MQSWYEEYREILQSSGIEERLRGIYVDDGRGVVKKLALGTRYNKEEKKFIISEEERKKDEEGGISREKLTENEMRSLMNQLGP